MKIASRQVYIADDGIEFDSEEECREYELRARLLTSFRAEVGVILDGYDEDQFIRWLGTYVEKWKPFK